MQIRGLHSSFYKLYSYSRKQECLEAYRKKYKNIVSQWDGNPMQWQPKQALGLPY